ncbi:imm11 family protein, partial [Calidithermus terrae]|uniref:imm11 family protein n=1 Tax=Calidithermus terrae TaxID=1408545 RepID=UPI0011C3F966
MKIYKIMDANLYGQARGLMARDPEQASRLSREVGRNEPIELAGRWEPIEVVPSPHNPGKPLGDFSFLGAENLLVMSWRAVEALGGELRAHGELLPLRSTAGEFYFFNVLRDVDAMDFDRSEVKWISGPKGRFLSRVYVYAFRPERLEGVLVFTMPYHGRQDHFVGEAFKERAERAGLQGFLFALVWDSEDAGYWDQRYEREQWEHVKRLHHAERFGLRVSPAPTAPAAPLEP